MSDWEVSPDWVHRCLQAGEPITLIDCRTSGEWDIARLEGAELIPLHELADELQRVVRLTEERGGPPIVYCHHGIRSMQAVAILKQAGLASARSMRGGLDLWSRRIDPGVPRY